MDLIKYLVCSRCGKPITFAQMDYAGRGPCCRKGYDAMSLDELRAVCEQMHISIYDSITRAPKTREHLIYDILARKEAPHGS